MTVGGAGAAARDRAKKGSRMNIGDSEFVENAEEGINFRRGAGGVFHGAMADGEGTDREGAGGQIAGRQDCRVGVGEGNPQAHPRPESAAGAIGGLFHPSASRPVPIRYLRVHD